MGVLVFASGESSLMSTAAMMSAAPIQVARRSVVDRVFLPPVRVGRQGHDADRGPEDAAGLLRAEERAVSAVVLDDEEPDHQEGRGNG